MNWEIEMDKKKTEDNGSTIRSDKMREILDRKPPVAARWGIFVIFALFAALFAYIGNLEYPYSGGETILHHFFN